MLLQPVQRSPDYYGDESEGKTCNEVELEGGEVRIGIGSGMGEVLI